ncbi:hypothetical protein Tco_0757632 [Tanacetum coccineum]
MVALESRPKHNMVAYLEKTDGNAEFHEIIGFLTRSSIHYALTISPLASTTFVEQFWMTTKSKTINNVRYITATVAGKPVSISEASIRSDLQFNDAAEIDVLSNQAIFDTIQLMGEEVSHVPKDKGAVSERPSETQPTPSLTHPSEDQSEPQPDPFLRPSSSNPIPDSHSRRFWWESWRSVTTQAAQIKDLKAQIKQLKKKAKPVISHHNAWIKSLFDALMTVIDYMEACDAHDEGTVKDSKKQESILILKPLPKIELKDKGKIVLEEEAESEAESKGVNEVERKRAKLLHDTIAAQRRFLAQQRYEEYMLLRLEDGTEINMLAERRYPLTKDTLERMLDLRLTTISNDNVALDLLRFIEKQIAELEKSEDSDGNEEDL